MTAQQDVIEYEERDRERLSVVREYVERVLEVGRDRWSGEDSPLLVDGVHVDSHEPVVWRYEGEEFVLSNLASQQTLFRALAGLSTLTGEEAYVEAARRAVEYHFERLAGDNGLLRWGGHQFVDLRTLEPVGHFDADTHEFKSHYPFYELLWETDPEATRRMLRAVWNAHVLDWGTLDMNRHGDYGQPMGDLWDNEFEDPDPFFEGDGLSFINIGSDLIYAAGRLHALNDEPDAWTWGERLAGMYVNARHPETGLGAYQYSKPRRRAEPPEEGSLAEHTTSRYGDRAENQFGEQFGAVAREGWVLWGGRVKTIYAQSGLVFLDLCERLGPDDDGGQLLEWTVDGLEALAEHAYSPEANAFRPMWADGTDLTGRSYDRTGYYGEQGTEWVPLEADMDFLVTYARAARLSGRERTWETVRAIADGLAIGDVGGSPDAEPDLTSEVPAASPEAVFALLELYRTTDRDAYLSLAREVADRMIEERYHHGFFLPSAAHVNARFDAVEPLAILALDAALRGRSEEVPAYVGGSGYVHGTFGDRGRVRDRDVIWSRTRDDSPESDAS